jgi:hypothetical protein
MQSNLGRTVFIALLAAGLFGLFLLVTPKLTTAGSGSGGTTSAAPTTVTPEPDVTAATCPCLPTSTTTTSVPTTTVPVTTTLPLGWDPASQTAANGYDGSVVMTASFISPRGSSVEAGDTVAWQIHVTNDTTEDLWGVFAYVEGFGPSVCDQRHIGAGESTDCWATGLAYVGTGDVVTWVNAWTEERQVKDIVRIPFTVIP